MKVVNWIRQNKILLLVVFVGSILRFYKLDFQSPWIDEIFTLHNTGSEKSFKEIYIFLKENDPHPPLYYFIVHFFYLIFDNTSLVARAISALFGIAGLFSIYYLAKELINKKVGLIAVALLMVNYFHIYYSQEARMYSMLFFTTTISFLFLVKFIKKPTIKSALFHALFASIMIYTHFFALFALFAQYIILLFFVIKPFQETSKRILSLSILSGVATVILYIPALFIFLQTSNRTSIWITIPDRDVYTAMFKEFFGFSETVLFISFVAVIYFLLQLFNRTEIKKYSINPIKEKEIFTFFVLFIWVFVTIFIPLILSYVNLPMIVSRYFINILPPIIILIAAGLYYIKSNIIKATFVILFVGFSVSDVVIVKKYYSNPTKTQFRELTNKIIKDDTNKIKVVTYWSWLIPYFFNSEIGIKVHPNTFQEYIIALKNETVDKKSFWYLDGHVRPFNLSQEEQNYLNEDFVLKTKLEYLDCWAYLYESKISTISTISTISETLNLNSFETTNRDDKGNILLFENTDLRSNLIFLEKGRYSLELSGISLPAKPINGENAHVILKLNGKILGDFNLSNNTNNSLTKVPFYIEEDRKNRFQIIYDNDFFVEGKDRNAILKSIEIKKLE
jgi:hypothetical protein